jgi:hypothetical protein
MLALKDDRGVVEASLPGLADFARVTLEQCEDALARLSGPDPQSRTKDKGGRRIVETDEGWEVVNHWKYSDKDSPEDRKKRRERNAAYMRDYRKRNAHVSDCKDKLPKVADLDTDTDTNTNTNDATRDAGARALEQESVQIRPAQSRSEHKALVSAFRGPFPDGHEWVDQETRTKIREMGLDWGYEVEDLRDHALATAMVSADWNADLRKSARRHAQQGRKGMSGKAHGAVEHEARRRERQKLRPAGKDPERVSDSEYAKLAEIAAKGFGSAQAGEVGSGVRSKPARARDGTG